MKTREQKIATGGRRARSVSAGGDSTLFSPGAPWLSIYRTTTNYYSFMKTKFILLALLSAFSLQPSALLCAATTINSANKYSSGANLGWMDWRGDINNGAVIDEYVCSGYIYAANVGWISLGSGSPTNGIYYQNLSASDFGVNQDGLGNLRGYAWGANIGWISLSNAVAYVKTDTIAAGALAPNGLPIA